MNLFGDLEGLQGELLATAGLRLILLRSQECRNEFLRLLNAKSPVGIVASRSHFSCYAEYATTHESLGSGRLDLIIELDSVVVGLEIKLAADFQPEQPQKYEEELIRVAGALSTVRRREMRLYVAVLGPASRRREVEAKLPPRQAFISWEETLASLKGAAAHDPFIKTLVRDYEAYLADHLDFLPHFDEWGPHLESQWEPGGTDYQREFLRKLVQVLPRSSPRIGAGDTWVGYYFQPDGMDHRTWIGFMPATRLDEPGQPGARLVLARQSPVADPQPGTPVEPQEKIRVDYKCASSWKLRINLSWNNPEDWKAALKPFLESPDVA